MATVIINPGTGPVHQACETDAMSNMVKFRDDVAERIGCKPEEIGIERLKNERSGIGTGRFSFTLTRGKHRSMVDMPGLLTKHVRWMNLPEQNIWDFPRLYVDGSSWVWFFAIGFSARDLEPALRDAEDDE